MYRRTSCVFPVPPSPITAAACANLLLAYGLHNAVSSARDSVSRSVYVMTVENGTDIPKSAWAEARTFCASRGAVELVVVSVYILGEALEDWQDK